MSTIEKNQRNNKTLLGSIAALIALVTYGYFFHNEKVDTGKQIQSSQKKQDDIETYNATDFYKKHFPAGKTFNGDYFSIKFLGFSADGRYLAFEEMGFPDMQIGGKETFLVDTDKNSWVNKPHFVPYEISTMGDDPSGIIERPKEIIRRDNMSVKKYLEAYRISGNLYGHHVVNGEFFIADGQRYAPDSTSFTVYNKIYKVQIKTENISIITGLKCPIYDIDLTKLEVTLENNNGNLITLQKDKNVPRWRQCPYYYAIEDVYVYKDRIAVFLRLHLPGWEGGLYKNMVVTGKMN